MQKRQLWDASETPYRNERLRDAYKYGGPFFVVLV